MIIATSAAKIAVKWPDFMFAVEGEEVQADICSHLQGRCWELGFLTPHTCAVGYCRAGSVSVL